MNFTIENQLGQYPNKIHFKLSFHNKIGMKIERIFLISTNCNSLI